MSYPKTKQEWWEQVDQSWADIMNLADQFTSLSQIVESEVKFINSVYKGTRREYMKKLKNNADPKLVNILNEIWGSAPDTPTLHKLKGWGSLCDLCSEEYVLHEEDNS